MGDWADHMTTVFPEVRLKKFLEMRGADGGPWDRLCALPALWTGLLYDGAALDAAWALVRDWSNAEREALRVDVARDALQAKFRGRKVADLWDRYGKTDPDLLLREAPPKEVAAKPAAVAPAPAAPPAPKAAPPRAAEPSARPEAQAFKVPDSPPR